MKNESKTYYLPHREKNGTWSFETPTGTVIDNMTEVHSRHVAAVTEKQDRERAATGSGIFDQVLRKHFEKEVTA